jgi:hypothetical protein
MFLYSFDIEVTANNHLVFYLTMQFRCFKLIRNTTLSTILTRYDAGNQGQNVATLIVSTPTQIPKKSKDGMTHDNAFSSETACGPPRTTWHTSDHRWSADHSFINTALVSVTCFQLPAALP